MAVLVMSGVSFISSPHTSVERGCLMRGWSTCQIYLCLTGSSRSGQVFRTSKTDSVHFTSCAETQDIQSKQVDAMPGHSKQVQSMPPCTATERARSTLSFLNVFLSYSYSVLAALQMWLLPMQMKDSSACHWIVHCANAPSPVTRE